MLTSLEACNRRQHKRSLRSRAILSLACLRQDPHNQNLNRRTSIFLVACNPPLLLLQCNSNQTTATSHNLLPSRKQLPRSHRSTPTSLAACNHLLYPQLHHSRVLLLLPVQRTHRRAHLAAEASSILSPHRLPRTSRHLGNNLCLLSTQPRRPRRRRTTHSAWTRCQSLELTAIHGATTMPGHSLIQRRRRRRPLLRHPRSLNQFRRLSLCKTMMILAAGATQVL
jgi:hypothetical protein